MVIIPGTGHTILFVKSATEKVSIVQSFNKKFTPLLATLQQIIQAKQILQTVFFPWRSKRLKFQKEKKLKKSTNTNKN